LAANDGALRGGVLVGTGVEGYDGESVAGAVSTDCSGDPDCDRCDGDWDGGDEVTGWRAIVFGVRGGGGDEVEAVVGVGSVFGVYAE
jgi:hypothetical protein